MIFRFVILAFVVSAAVGSLSTNRFCRLADQEKCATHSRKYSYSCGDNFCSANEQECNEYLNYEKKAYVIRSKVQINSRHLDFINKFIGFKNKIQPCKDQQPDGLDARDVCAKKMDCYALKKNRRHMSRLYLAPGGNGSGVLSFQKIECPCQGKHSFECGQKGHCTVNEKACQLLLRSKREGGSFKNCGN